MLKHTVKSVIKMEEFNEYKKKRVARLELTRALKHGRLVRADKCELCAKQAPTQGHHVDYGKPLDVKWLCDSCHGYAHQRNHPLNAANNPQTPLDIEWKSGDSMTVSFILPIKNFVNLKKLAEKRHLNVSQVLREIVMVTFPDEHGGEMYDDPQNDSHARISSVEKNEKILLKQELSCIQVVWREGDNHLPRMDQRLQQVLSGNGTHPRKLQRPAAAGK